MEVTTILILASIMHLFSVIRIYQIHFFEEGLSKNLWEALSQIFLYAKDTKQKQTISLSSSNQKRDKKMSDCDIALEEYMRETYRNYSGDILSFESFWAELSAGELKKLWHAACDWQKQQAGGPKK